MANSKVVAGAGEHYVAYALSCLGHVAALVREGSPSVDILASNVTGSRAVGIQVKTTTHAVRKRGRGENRKPHELQFPLGHKAVENASENLVFCFVDLKGLVPNTSPDVYVIPGSVFVNHYAGKNIRKHKWLRLHWPIERMEQYKNNWEPIEKALAPERILFSEEVVAR